MRLIIEILMCMIAAYSFGVIFNIKGKFLNISAVGGGIAWLSYKIMIVSGAGNGISFFVATICFGIYVELCARIYSAPSTMMSVCAMIILVPGYGVYNTLYGFMTNNYTEAVKNGIDTLLIAGAISLGLVFITTIFRNKRVNKIIHRVLYKYRTIEHFIEKNR